MGDKNNAAITTHHQETPRGTRAETTKRPSPATKTGAHPPATTDLQSVRELFVEDARTRSTATNRFPGRNPHHSASDLVDG